MSVKQAKGATQCSIIDPFPLMIAYLDGVHELTNDEREILLFALYMENLKLEDSLAQRAVAALKERGRI